MWPRPAFLCGGGPRAAGAGERRATHQPPRNPRAWEWVQSPPQSVPALTRTFQTCTGDRLHVCTQQYILLSLDGDPV